MSATTYTNLFYSWDWSVGKTKAVLVTTLPVAEFIRVVTGAEHDLGWISDDNIRRIIEPNCVHSDTAEDNEKMHTVSMRRTLVRSRIHFRSVRSGQNCFSVWFSQFMPFSTYPVTNMPHPNSRVYVYVCMSVRVCAYVGVCTWKCKWIAHRTNLGESSHRFRIY